MGAAAVLDLLPGLHCSDMRNFAHSSASLCALSNEGRGLSPWVELALYRPGCFTGAGGAHIAAGQAACQNSKNSWQCGRDGLAMPASADMLCMP